MTVTREDFDRIGEWLFDAKRLHGRPGSDARVCELLDGVSSLAAMLERDIRADMHPITAAMEGRATWSDARDGTFTTRIDRQADVARIRHLIAEYRKEQNR